MKSQSPSFEKTSAVSFQPLLRKFAVLLMLTICAGMEAFGQNASQNDFENIARAAATARDAGRTAEAIADYQKAVALRPNWGEGWWYLGTLLYDSDQPVQAIPAFRKVVQLQPGFVDGWDFLGLCEFGAKEYEQALKSLEKGHSLGAPDDPQLANVAAYHLALLRNRAGRFSEARELLAKSFVSGAPSSQLAQAFGLSLLHIPLLPTEVETSKDALVQSVGQLGIRTARGDAEKAAEEYPTLIAQYPDAPYLHEAYAHALKAAGREAAANEQMRLEAKDGAKGPASNEKALVLAYYGNEAVRGAAGAKVGGTKSTSKAAGPSFDSLVAEASAAQRANHPEEAAQKLKQALTLHPDWADGNWQLAKIYFSGGRFEEAVPYLKQIVAAQPDSGTAWGMLGLAEFESKDYANSLLHLRKGAALGLGGTPDAVRLAKYRLALLLIRDGEFGEATPLLVPEAEGNAFASEVKFALGLALLKRKQLPEKVAAADVPLVRAAGEVSLLLYNSKYDEAFSRLDALLKQYPDAPILHYTYGVALSSMSRYDESERMFREEARISPKSELPWVQIAFVKLQLQQPEEAVNAAKRAMQLAPGTAEAHYVMGRSLLESGKAEEAVKELEAAEQLNPGSPEVHFNLARAYSKLHRAEDAQRERATFARLNAEMERRRSQQGSQAYGAAHSTSDLSQAGQAPPTAVPPKP